MKKLMQLVFKYKIYPALMLIVCILLALFVVLQNIAIADFLNIMLFKVKQSPMIILSFIFVVLMIRATLNFCNQLLGNRLSIKVKHDLRQRVIHHQSTQSVGEEMTLLTETINGIAPFYQSYLPQVFKSMMIPLAIMIAMCFVHLNTALIMIITAPFIPLFYIIFGLKTRDESKDQMTYLNQFGQRFLNMTQGLITLKLFNRTKQTENKIYEDSTHFRDLTMKILRSAFLSSLMLEFISLLGIGLVALEAALSLVVFHTIDFKTAAIAIILAPEFYNAIKDLGQAFHTGKQSEGASDVVFEYLESTSENSVPINYYHTNQSPLISLSNVMFKYSNEKGNDFSIKHVTLDINEHEHIALVGPSGAGKTTFAKLISQSLKPTEGHVSYKYDQMQIGILSQRPYIFTATIKDNISMFNDVSDDIILEALEQVQLKEKVQSLKNGIHTLIGDGGEMLSGGQMRRIELCRLLVMEPDLVILDEPATGLDIETEQVIQSVMHHQFKATTQLIIAHRDSTIRQATRRLYIHDGEIIKDDKNISVNVKENGDES
ncbi:ABC transporter ATP-binding protein/permease [Staphylococcus pasteuri]|uniref:ABC transporter ATP-binding protein/permease n=1 Tax=Staphylococcus pasteuri TaxID=45972 RepID=UPI001C268720|nr:ABC transporter ATP-binding protein/permease [Staphylococcus pasteuri]MCO0861976.1 ABC transporter ATP-binding protein/permease [Staphylococcus pasteuri]MCO5360800.1 ABC transporter ATP-binding protein/permease [Staphylococcus pasteuri]UXR67085.1 ABC transporter ATP-binding protein/permease [Staphylococcus pasteuri]